VKDKTQIYRIMINSHAMNEVCGKVLIQNSAGVKSIKK